MTMRQSLVSSAALILLASSLGACAKYDYLQHTDRVSYHAGDAVRANLERETINPSSGSMYDTSGLGKNGSVIPPETSKSTTTSAAPPAAAPTSPTTSTSPL